jgi:WASH complex subunit 7
MIFLTKIELLFFFPAPVPDLAELVYLNETGLDHQLGSSASSLKNHNDTMDMADGLFESLAKSNPALSSLSELSSKALDKVLDDLAQNLSESSDYFKLLVDVFRPFFRDPRHSHLRHFYVIVPPLTVNYVEHIVTCKEKLMKKNKQETCTFTDDGLAMGLAYCLSVLDQWKDFDALQWFSSVREFFERERKMAGLQSQASQDTLSLTLHRLETYRQVKLKK